MTIIEAINKADALEHNAYSQEDKIEWLNRVDNWVKRMVLDTHEPAVEFTGYDTSTPLNTELLIYEPYSEAYIHYIHTQIFLHNGEYDRYNNAASLYNKALQEFMDDYNRAHKPKSFGPFRF